ncbi:hypothetical protein B0H11DRAFT_2295322 [Mycena galericulata]|nr:hypothetical protein B0H11DRAFT_2295322 [Mycena galericulata]
MPACTPPWPRLPYTVASVSASRRTAPSSPTRTNRQGWGVLPSPSPSSLSTLTQKIPNNDGVRVKAPRLPCTVASSISAVEWENDEPIFRELLRAPSAPSLGSRKHLASAANTPSPPALKMVRADRARASALELLHLHPAHPATPVHRVSLRLHKRTGQSSGLRCGGTKLPAPPTMHDARGPSARAQPRRNSSTSTTPQPPRSPYTVTPSVSAAVEWENNARIFR